MCVPAHVLATAAAKEHFARRREFRARLQQLVPSPAQLDLQLRSPVSDDAFLASVDQDYRNDLAEYLTRAAIADLSLEE